MEVVVYLNGALIPLTQARISPMDYGFLHGYGLFETMRAYSGRVFRLEKHLARLERSARALNIDLDGPAKLETAIYETLRANHLPDARKHGPVGVHQAAQHRVQRQREITVGDGRLPRRLARGARGIDVDPLVVTSGIGEGVHARLRDLVPVTAVDFLADLRLQALEYLIL